MNPAEIVLLIIVVVVLGRVARDRMRYQAQAHAAALPREDSLETRALRDEVRQMKERIAVLERVVTDNHGSIDLDRQIEQLRDR